MSWWDWSVLQHWNWCLQNIRQMYGYVGDENERDMSAIGVMLEMQVRLRCRH
jgi:hypothetical protein